MEIMLKTCTIPAGKKTGKWIFRGKDHPRSKYGDNIKVEEGRFVKGRKEGIWIKYYRDGKTTKLKGIIPITDLLASISGIIKMPKNNLKLTSFKISIRELIIVITAMVSWHTAEITTIMVRNLG